MKKFFAIFTVGVALAFSSCNDLCRNVDCGANGTCDEADGKCLCNTGYELGTDEKCSVESRAKFIGTWRGTDCGSSASHDIVVSTSSSDITKVRISNFSNADCSTGNAVVATATVSTDGTALGTFTTDCPAANGYVINATGNSATLNAAGTIMTLSYNVTIGGTDYTCTLQYTKQ